MLFTRNQLTTRSITPPYSQILKDLFPKEAYKSSGKETALHYLIALDQPLSTIKTWIEKQIQYINFQAADKKKLTPIMIAAMKGNSAVISLLIEKKANFSLQDWRGWAVFHHAASTQDNTLLDILLKNTSSDNYEMVKDIFNGTYKDIQELLSNTPIINENEIVCLYREAETVQECTAKEFKEKTKSQYTKKNIVSSELLAKWWASNKDTCFIPINEQEKQEIQESLKNLPKISFGKENRIGEFTVYAEETIPSGRIIGIYTGELWDSTVDEIKENSVYKFGSIDGKRIKNLMPLMNDSFPNVLFYNIPYKGQLIHIAKSLRTIKEGEQMFCDYTYTHSIKYHSRHCELNEKDLEDFITSFSPIGQINTDEKILYFKFGIAYMISTPSSIAYALGKKLPIAKIIEETKTELVQKGLGEILSKVLGYFTDNSKPLTFQSFLERARSFEQILSYLDEKTVLDKFTENLRNKLLKLSSDENGVMIMQNISRYEDYFK